MCAERIVSGTKFLDSIRGGMSVRELMEKHDLSLGELSSILVQLENASVDVLRLYGRTSLDLPAQDKRRLRFLPRRRVLAPVPVIDMTDPTNAGLLVDVTERGLGVVGVHARLHEVKSFKIAADRVFRISGFQLQAESELLRHPEDTRDWNIFVDNRTRRDTTDRFVLRFVKP